MKVYIRKHKRLKIVATTKPERNLLKHFSKKEPHIVGFGITTMGMKNEETEVTLELSFRTLAKPKLEPTIHTLMMKESQEDLE